MFIFNRPGNALWTRTIQCTNRPAAHYAGCGMVVDFMGAIIVLHPIKDIEKILFPNKILR